MRAVFRTPEGRAYIRAADTARNERIKARAAYFASRGEDLHAFLDHRDRERVERFSRLHDEFDSRRVLSPEEFERKREAARVKQRIARNRAAARIKQKIARNRAAALARKAAKMNGQ